MIQLPDDIHAVCFDAFGTIVEIQDKCKPYRTLLKNADHSSRSAVSHRLMREDLSLADVLEIIKPECSETEIDQFQKKQKREINSIRLRAGIKEKWSELREAGIKIAICSNLSTPYGQPMLDLLPDTPDATILSYETGYVKPEKEIYQLISEKLNITAHNILFVGDTPEADVIGPRQIGMQSMLISEFLK